MPISLSMLEVLAKAREWDRFDSLSVEVGKAAGENGANRARFHRVVATGQEMRGDHEAALTELEQAESAAPLNVETAFRRADILLKLGRPHRAAAEFRKILKIDPGCARAAAGLRALDSDAQEP